MGEESGEWDEWVREWVWEWVWVRVWVGGEWGEVVRLVAGEGREDGVGVR